MTGDLRPDPEIERAPALADMCSRCTHAWHGLRCHCSCLTSWSEPEQAPPGGGS